MPLVSINPDIVCPFKTKLHSPMKIWAVMFECSCEERPEIYVYLTCDCCEDVLEVIPKCHSERDEYWVSREMVHIGLPSVSMKTVRGMK